MKIWLVNPFDPLPGDPEQEVRYASLSRHLAAAGHQVVWWTSGFSHRFKRPVNQRAIALACAGAGVEPRFLAAPPYHRNIGVRRLVSHALLARAFARQARGLHPDLDLVLASSPPPDLAWQACRAARARGARILVDVQDLWPETFARLAPPPLRPVAQRLLAPLQRRAQAVYRAADALVGVADAYLDRAASLAGPAASRPQATIPLGLDLASFDAAATAGRCERFTKPPGQIWLAYTGSISRSYDMLTVLRALPRMPPALRARVRIFITGRGELLDAVRQVTRDARLDNVTITGFLEFPTWAYLLRQCDVGLNAVLPEALIYLPKKLFYYLGAGLAVLSTIPGQCSRILQAARCGLDYIAGDAESCAAALGRLVESPEGCAEMGRAARRLAETAYDHAVLMPRYVQLIEQLGGERRAGADRRGPAPPAEGTRGVWA